MIHRCRRSALPPLTQVTFALAILSYLAFLSNFVTADATDTAGTRETFRLLEDTEAAREALLNFIRQDSLDVYAVSKGKYIDIRTSQSVVEQLKKRFTLEESETEVRPLNSTVIFVFMLCAKVVASDPILLVPTVTPFIASPNIFFVSFSTSSSIVTATQRMMDWSHFSTTSNPVSRRWQGISL